MRNSNLVAQKYVDLAVGTHVLKVPPGIKALNVMVASAAGTANIDYTFDPGETSDGTAPPAEDFASGVLSQTWTTGASADAVERIAGPVTAVRVTVATNVATVVLAPES